ncbi:hypothetical protein Taro_056762 [Colocasia esculenta]|uniref:Uncharacterized protein n=1 Tax=Colocasia esculenta TaxID=4460 RepID=A0A843XYD7_COLES|nr:hypothetical protein [Colocasia esculenta]
MGRCKELPDGTQRWVDDESRDRFEKMTQMTTPSLQSDDAAPDQNKKVEELCAERSRDRQELQDLCAERSRDRQELQDLHSQISEMRAIMQQYPAPPSHPSRARRELECEESDESADDYDDDD